MPTDGNQPLTPETPAADNVGSLADDPTNERRLAQALAALHNKTRERMSPGVFSSVTVVVKIKDGLIDTSIIEYHEPMK